MCCELCIFRPPTVEIGNYKLCAYHNHHRHEHRVLEWASRYLPMMCGKTYRETLDLVLAMTSDNEQARLEFLDSPEGSTLFRKALDDEKYLTFEPL